MPRVSKKARLATSAAAAALAAIPVSTGQCKALELPPELLLEILSYYTFIPMDGADNNVSYYRHLPSWANERSDVVRALSQTCTAWRAFFWPMLWESVEAGALGKGVGSWYRKLSNTLISKGNGLASNPDIAKRVRHLRIVITRCSIFTVLPALIRCMHACTNLKTLNIVFAHNDISSSLKNAFAGESFPSVETVILPTQTHNILRSCPNVKRVHCNNHDGSQLISAIAANCKNVEVVTGIRPTLPMVKRIVKAAPNLQKIGVSYLCSDNVLVPISGLEHLRVVELTAGWVMGEDKVEQTMAGTFKFLKGVLKPGATIVVNSSHRTFSGQGWTKTIRV